MHPIIPAMNPMPAGQVSFPSTQSILQTTGSIPFYPPNTDAATNLQNYQFSYHANPNTQPTAPTASAAATTYLPTLSNISAAPATSAAVPFTPTIPSQPNNMPSIINLNGISYMVVPIFQNQTTMISPPSATVQPIVNPQTPIQHAPILTYASSPSAASYSLSAATPQTPKKPSTLKPSAAEFIPASANEHLTEEPAPLYNYSSPLYFGPAMRHFVASPSKQAETKLSSERKPIEKRPSSRLPILPWTDKAATATAVTPEAAVSTPSSITSVIPPATGTAAVAASADKAVTAAATLASAQPNAETRQVVVSRPQLSSLTGTPETSLAASNPDAVKLQSAAASTTPPQPLTEEQQKIANAAANSGLVPKATNESPKPAQTGTFECCQELFAQKKLDEALDAVNKLISGNIKPENRALFLRAEILISLKNLNKADDAQAYKDLANIIENSSSTEAIKDKIKAMGLLAYLYYYDGKIDDAQKLYEKILNINESPLVLGMLGLIAFEKGAYKAAKDYLAKLPNHNDPRVIAFIKISEKLGSENYKPLNSPAVEKFINSLKLSLKNFRQCVCYMLEASTPSEENSKAANSIYQSAIDSTLGIVRDSINRLQASSMNVAHLNKGCFFAREYGQALIASDRRLSTKKDKNSEPTAVKKRLDLYKQKDRFLYGYINTKFYTLQKLNDLGRRTFRINADVKPSDAINAAIEGPSLIDDTLAFQISLYKTIMHAIGKEKFDAIFSSKGITPLEISDFYSIPLDYLQVDKTYKSISDLQMGETAIINNCRTYNIKHFKGEKAGLQVMCLKPGKNPTLLCFGSNPNGVKLDDVIESLRKEFNKPEIKYSDLFTAETAEGIRSAMPQIYAIKRVKQKNKLLTAIEFKNLGGGFVGNYKALDINKIEKLKKAGIRDCQLMLLAWQLEHSAIIASADLK